jgi:hypothetical protein
MRNEDHRRSYRNKDEQQHTMFSNFHLLFFSSFLLIVIFVVVRVSHSTIRCAHINGRWWFILLCWYLHALIAHFGFFVFHFNRAIIDSDKKGILHVVSTLSNVMWWLDNRIFSLQPLNSCSAHILRNSPLTTPSTSMSNELIRKFLIIDLWISSTWLIFQLSIQISWICDQYSSVWIHFTFYNLSQIIIMTMILRWNISFRFIFV